MGAECDGASYHSAKSTRDRDRLRQEVLESKGWTIHRIWSTDWFVNREKEIQRLLTHIQKVLEKFPVVDARKTPKLEPERIVAKEPLAREVNVEEAEGGLRAELIEYRRQNIDAAFAGPQEANILSPQMIELLVHRKPITKDEFFNYVPQAMRVKLDGRHVQRFLPDIFEIIEAYV